jgi:hypothetical protein
MHRREVLIGTLADLFTRAERAALAADPGENADGGSCCLDTPAFLVEGARETDIQEAAKRSGLSVDSFRWLGGRRWFWLRTTHRGQANRRSTMMEAAQRVLNDCATAGVIPGFRACGYQQAD